MKLTFPSFSGFMAVDGSKVRRVIHGIHGLDDARDIPKADPAISYNMSYLVQQAGLNNKPIIGISINYRMAAFGFIYSKEVANTNNQNLGLHDQRVALQWVNKHISSFGGDPSKVTLWGRFHFLASDSRYAFMLFMFQLSHTLATVFAFAVSVFSPSHIQGYAEYCVQKTTGMTNPQQQTA
jgi:hypothetical protein